jgi:diguanylate cyclase (GGDEF)-like protein
LSEPTVRWNIVPLFNIPILLAFRPFSWPEGVAVALAGAGVVCSWLGPDALPYAAGFLATALGAILILHDRNRALNAKTLEYEALADEHLVAYDNIERYREKKEALDRRLSELSALQAATSALALATSYRDIYLTTVDTALKLCDCDTALVALLKEENDSLVVTEFRGGFTPWVSGEEFELAKGVLGWVARHGQPELVQDVGGDPRFQATSKEALLKSVIAVPLVSDSRVSAVLLVGRVDEPDLSRDQLFLMSGLATQSGMALHRAYLHNELERLAITDGLTGLYNRRYFDETISKEAARAERYQGRYSVILLDVDNFKNYNDKNGHPAGDRLLIQVADIVRRSVRQIDIAARYGGEEFVVILPETDGEAAVRVAERIRSSLQALEFEGADRQPLGYLSASLGIAAFPAHGASGREIVASADAALYRAKTEGRNRCIIAG